MRAPLQAQFYLRLLGPLEIEQGEVRLRSLQSRKALAVLSYLITRNEAIARVSLATLFWPQLPEGRALRNLTWAISRLGHYLPNCIIADSQVVRYQPCPQLWIDLIQFRELIAHSTPAALSEAITLYRGELLEGFYLDDCPEFELWLLREREAWQQRLAAALETLITHERQRGDYRQALGLVDRLLQMEPWREEAHRQYMELLVLAGQRSRALLQYQACRRILWEELGVEPSPETTLLYQQIRAGLVNREQEIPTLLPAQFPPWQNLDTSLTPFFGRTSELARLMALLDEPSVRLITIVGPGGVGKTRLALQLVQQQHQHFRNGVAVVQLASIGSTTLLISAIVDALGITLTSQGDQAAQLLQALGPKHILLVLDNFEHLMESRSVLLEMLQSAPRLTIIVTSRECLHLQAEHLLRLQGFDVPDAQAKEGEPLSPAVQLFAERAQRVDSSFRLSSENRSAVAQICRIVEGNPLGIELAATWAHQLTPPAIVTVLQNNLDMLATSMQDLPEHHRSMRAVFSRSWQLLTPAEQHVLALLAIFHGGFTQEAMLAVTKATIWELTALVNKSLVRRATPGRYAIHELVRQYALEFLRAQFSEGVPLEEVVREQHSAFYLGLVTQAATTLHGPQQHEVAEALRQDLDNIRQAWQWVVTRKRFDQISASLPGLSSLYLHLCLFHEADSVFGSLAEQLEILCRKNGQSQADLFILANRLRAEQVNFLVQQAVCDRAIVLAEAILATAQQYEIVDLEATIELYWAHALFFQGRYELAQLHATRSIELAQTICAPQMEANGLCLLGRILGRRNNHLSARSYFEKSLETYRVLGNRMGTAITFNFLGNCAWYEGDYTTAQTYFEHYLQHCQEIGNPQQIARGLHNLADSLWPQGEYLRAEELFSQALAINRELGTHYGASMALVNSVPPLLMMNNLDEAKRRLVQALRLSREHGIRCVEGMALLLFGHLAHRKGDHESALVYARQSLQIAQETGDQYEQADALMCLGIALEGLGYSGDAERSYQQVLDLRRALHQEHLANEALAGLARTAMARNDLAQARAYVDSILQYLTHRTLAGTLNPRAVYQTCLDVVCTCQAVAV